MYNKVRNLLVIDYEYMNLINFWLQVGSSIIITVYIDDVNDNSPYFIGSPYSAEISESTPIGKYKTFYTLISKDWNRTKKKVF